ncbi:MAG: FAD/NAD(P)-binding protein [Lacunisphaera sp.]
MPSSSLNLNPASAIAIIGGGASGCLVAAQLLRQSRGPQRILLFERMSEVGRGVAYGTDFPGHLLNVPAGRMGAFPDVPGHFLAWVAARVGHPGFPATVAAGDFLSRRLYGDYLRAVLTDAREAAAPGVVLEEIKAEVVDAEFADGLVRLRCGGGQYFAVDRVVLAIGNLPGEYPIRGTLPIYHSQSYVHVPWRPGALEGIPRDAEVLLVGAGLTAIDLVLELHGRGHTGAIHALSRRGLLPQEHRPAPVYPDFLQGEPLPATILGFSRRLRAEVRRAQAQGNDWRPVIDSLRPHAQTLWQGFSWEERARFMRHVRPFWEVHRHRVAPPVAARIEELRRSDRLRFYAGRLTGLEEKSGGVEARFRLRGTTQIRSLRVARVINCTGPRTDYSKYQHPLLLNLLANGLIDHDPLALGIRATTAGEVLDHNGRIVPWLHTIGAPLKGDLWECTAIPRFAARPRSSPGSCWAAPADGAREWPVSPGAVSAGARPPRAASPPAWRS